MNSLESKLKITFSQGLGYKLLSHWCNGLACGHHPILSFPCASENVITCSKLNDSKLATICTSLTHWPLGDRNMTLTHLPVDKMAAILADNIFKLIFLNKYRRIPIQIALEFVPRSPTDNKAALVQVMAWRRTNKVNPVYFVGRGYNDNPVHWCIYGTLGTDELKTWFWNTYWQQELLLPLKNCRIH